MVFISPGFSVEMDPLFVFFLLEEWREVKGEEKSCRLPLSSPLTSSLSHCLDTVIPLTIKNMKFWSKNTAFWIQ